jgi:hypothetical protein
LKLGEFGIFVIIMIPVSIIISRIPLIEVILADTSLNTGNFIIGLNLLWFLVLLFRYSTNPEGI